MPPPVKTSVLVGAALIAGLTPVSLLSQGAEPLRKTDVIRLITSPLIAKSDVADLISRNCLSFTPTERDWSDFRRVGADAAILGSIGACNRRRVSGGTVPEAPHPTPLQSRATVPEALHATPLQSRLLAAPGTTVGVRVLLTRGERGQMGVRLMLRGSAEVTGDAADVEAVTDERGVALFNLPIARGAGTYALRVTVKDGPDIPGRPVVELLVRSGLAVRATVQPASLNLDSSSDVTAVVAVSDSFGNVVPDEKVEIRASSPSMGFSSLTRTTDSLGRAAFLIRPRTLRSAGTLRVSARGTDLASLEAVHMEAVADSGSGFLRLTQQAGTVRMPLDAPLSFQVRGTSGRSLPGRVVVFRANNAEVEPERATTDAAGIVQVQVTLGSRSGPATVTATVDSVQRQATWQVTAGPATQVIIEQNGIRVDGGHLFVTPDTIFVLRVSARDAYGNPAPIGALARALEQMPKRFNDGSKLLRILSVQSDDSSCQITFRPKGRGSAPLSFADATVTIDVVPRARSAMKR